MIRWIPPRSGGSFSFVLDYPARGRQLKDRNTLPKKVLHCGGEDSLKEGEEDSLRRLLSVSLPKTEVEVSASVLDLWIHLLLLLYRKSDRFRAKLRELFWRSFYRKYVSWNTALECRPRAGYVKCHHESEIEQVLGYRKEDGWLRKPATAHLPTSKI
uniref:Uncharacterized protein n=1 Tax=Steinernema glaseri TaxID=37863 RepID=A0A1I7XZZ1_9BILA